MSPTIPTTVTPIRACVVSQAYAAIRGYPDDHPVLTTLRGFRELYVRVHDAGQQLIAEYYKLSEQLEGELGRQHLLMIVDTSDKCFDAINSGDMVAAHAAKDALMTLLTHLAAQTTQQQDEPLAA